MLYNILLSLYTNSISCSLVNWARSLTHFPNSSEKPTWLPKLVNLLDGRATTRFHNMFTTAVDAIAVSVSIIYQYDYSKQHCCSKQIFVETLNQVDTPDDALSRSYHYLLNSIQTHRYINLAYMLIDLKFSFAIFMKEYFFQPRVVLDTLSFLKSYILWNSLSTRFVWKIARKNEL